MLRDNRSQRKTRGFAFAVWLLFWSLIQIYITFSSCFVMIPRATHRNVARATATAATTTTTSISLSNDTKGNEIQGEIENRDDIDTEDVSDAEALLACWSYLQRHKRLGNWTQYEQRMSQKALSRTFFLNEDELTEQKQHQDEFARDYEKKLTLYKDEEYSEKGADNVEQSRTFASSETGLTDADVILFGAFTSLESKPSISQRRRSKASKKRWSDPEFRKRWYKSRWGDRVGSEEKLQLLKRDRRAEALARELPKGFLGSPELASMTKDEIAEAITTRINSTKLRSVVRKETLRKRKKLLTESTENVFLKAEQKLHKEKNGIFHQSEPKIDRNSLFLRTHEQLKESQRKRSERAKKIYERRMINEKAKMEALASQKPNPVFLVSNTNEETSFVERPFYPPKQATPRDALLRVDYDLDRGKYPSLDDIHLVLQPKRLANRQSVLQRILNDTFGLYGKCVPIFDSTKREENQTPIRYEFVTHTSLDHLGMFILSLLEDEASKKV